MKETNKTFKLAKEAEEKGFINHTLSTGFTNRYLLGGKNTMINETCIFLWLCELQNWLKNTHNIILVIAPIYEDNTHSKIKFWYYIQGIDDESDDEVFYNTWEEALEEGLIESIKLLKRCNL